MSIEPEPNPSTSPAKAESETPKNQDAAAKEAAAKALGQAKEKMTAGLDAFKKLDMQAQIYLAGLAVSVLCSLIFSFWSVKMDGPGGDLLKQHMPSVTVFDAGANGKLAVLAAAAGIGLWIWNFTAKKKEAWAPLAIAGSAGLSAVLFLVLWLRISGSVPSMEGLGVKVSSGTTLLGFWLPFAGAIAATVVSVKRILNPPAAPVA
jgi:hypothetical protein